MSLSAVHDSDVVLGTRSVVTAHDGLSRELVVRYKILYAAELFAMTEVKFPGAGRDRRIVPGVAFSNPQGAV